MSQAFIDTNVLVYMYDDRDREKQRMARLLIGGLTEEGSAVISIQVVREFYNTILHKLNAMPATDMQPIAENVLWPKVKSTSELALYERAAKLRERHGLSFYDALIVQTALDLECDILYSEDLQDGQTFGRLKIQNPFK